MKELEEFFDVAIEAPDGIKKLRELILTLAMQGRLVPQDPLDRPASELLKEIEAEKKQLAKEGKIKAPKLVPPIDPDKVPYDLPNGWEWVRFSTVAEHNAGKTLDGGRNTGVLCEYITTSNLYWGRFELSDLRQMPIEDAELDRCTARKGDLLICEGGEAGRAAVWRSDKEICFQNHIHRARFYKGIDAFFVYRFFEKLNASGEISQYRQGMGITNMSGKSLALIVLPIPPLPEQRRIVAKVEELMARCDKLEKLRQERDRLRVAAHSAAVSALQAASDQESQHQAWNFIAQHFGDFYSVKGNLAELRKTILQLAVMGRLVPQDPSDQPASELLKEIEAEKKRLVKEGKIKAPKPHTPIAPDEVPYDLPKGWEWVRYSALVSSFDYGTSVKSESDSSKIPVFGMGNIFDRRLVTTSLKYVDPDNVDMTKLQLIPGDILFNRTNSPERVGKSAIYNGECGTATFASYLIRVRLISLLLATKYVHAAMSAAYFRTTQIEPKLVQECGQANFNGSKLANTLIPLPPLPEQRRIVAKIDELMARCDELEKLLEDAVQKKSSLLTAMVNVV